MPEIIIYLIFYLFGLILLPIKTPNLFNLVKRYFFSLSKGVSSLKRIGPHNKDFLSFIIGSILGDSHLEKRKGGLGTRIIPTKYGIFKLISSIFNR
jgi:hypothetical protein